MMPKFKVGDRVEYLEDGKQIDSGIICNAPEGSSSRILGKVWAIWGSAPGMPLWCDESEVRLSDKDKPALPSSFKIDVQAYADENNISLEQAHNEIQPWLFENCKCWSSCIKDVSYTNKRYLFCGSKLISFDSDEIYFRGDIRKQIFLSRNVPVSLSVKEEEIVEVMGKKYRKSDVENALKFLEWNEGA